MKFQKYFDNGLKSLKKGDYLSAVSNFEECLAYDKNDYLVYYYLGLTYIFRKDYEDAYKFLLKAYKLNSEDVSVINAIAFVNLKDGNIQESINYWLDALDIEPKNVNVKRNLEKVRKAKDVKKLSEIAKPEDFIGFKIKRKLSLPPITFILIFKKIKIKYIVGIVIPLFLIFILYLLILKPTYNSKKIAQPINISSPQNLSIKSLNKIKLPEIEEDYIQDKNIKKSLFKFTKSDTKFMFNKCKQYIKRKKFNSATIIINKILHSNLHFIIKEKFRILKEFIPEIKKFKINDNISYSEVMNFPAIYEDVQIIWEGKVEDIKFEEEKNITRFKFIVKENNDTVGVTEVYLNQILPVLKNSITIKLLGRFEGLKEGTRYPLVEGKSIKIIEDKR